ncbi:MAG: phosphoethanolamine transferase, partial [Lautropia sp.]
MSLQSFPSSVQTPTPGSRRDWRRWLRAGTCPALSPTALVVLAASWFTLVLNAGFWTATTGRLAAGAAGSPLLIAQLFGFLLCVNVLLIGLFRFPWVLKPALVCLLLACSAAAYFMREYRIMIDDDMLRNVLQTDRLEVQGLLSPTLWLTMLVLGVLPAALVWRARLRWAGPVRTTLQTVGLCALSTVLALASLAIDLKAAAPFIREQGKALRWHAMPLNLMLASAYLLRDAEGVTSSGPLERIASTVRLGADDGPPSRSVLILVVGETARAMNFSLNGYARPTNPMLATLPVTSFTQVSSCGTATATSLPCMFSDLSRAAFAGGRARNRENLLDIAKRAGYRVVWVDNQAGSKGVSARVENRVVVAPGGAGAEASDLELIPAFEQLLGLPDRHLLVVLHQMGSHGPEYHKRS